MEEGAELCKKYDDTVVDFFKAGKAYIDAHLAE